MSGVARTAVAVPLRKPKAAQKHSERAASMSRMSAHVQELREVLGAGARVVWMPEMSAKERAAYEKSVRAREEAGDVDWVVKELRSIRAGRA